MLNLKRSITISILFLLLLFYLSSNVSAENEIYIDKPTNVSTIVTVNENFSIHTKLIFTFINSFNQPTRVEYFFPIVDYVGGDFDLYATNSSLSALTINGSRVYVLNGTLLPYTDISFPLEWNRPSSDNNPSDGIYTMDVGHFSSLEGIVSGEIEVRIPLQKGDYDYLKEPINYEIPPKNQYKTDDYLILYWGEEIEQVVHLSYSYEFNFNKFISSHPLEMMIIFCIAGVLLDRFVIGKLIDIYKKKKKKPERKEEKTKAKTTKKKTKKR